MIFTVKPRNVNTPKMLNTPNSEHFSSVPFFSNTFSLSEEWTPPNPKNDFGGENGPENLL